MKKKVLIVITKSNWGGAQRHIFDLATNLPKENFEVVVALGGNGELKTRLEQENTKVVSIPHLNRDINIFSDFKVFFDLIKIIKKEKPDVLHLHSSKIGGIGSLAGRFTKTPKIIFTVHGWAFNEDRVWWQKTIIKILSWFTVILSHQTIVVSKNTKRQIQKYPFISKKFSVIRNAIRPIEFKEKKIARNLLLGEQKEEKIWLGTIAELHKNKGLKYVFKALQILNNQNIIFVIIGEGEEREHLEELIKMKGLEKQVFLLGQIENASQYLKAYDIFVLPSITEALPYVLLEAGSSEIPIIASNVGGVPEVIQDSETGILSRAKDSKDIAHAIMYIINNHQKAKFYIRNLKNKIKKDFRLERMIEEISRVYYID